MVNGRSIALGSSLVLLLAGCSVWINSQDRIGPQLEHDIAVGALRADIERVLGRPIATESLPEGNTKAVYEYTARIGADRQGAGLMLVADLLVFGLLWEPFMTPLSYFAKDKVTYHMEYVYDRDGRVLNPVPPEKTIRVCRGPLLERRCRP